MNLWTLLCAYLGFAALLFVATWLVYLANMAALAAGERATAPAKALLHLAPVMSTALNWLVFTLVLAEVPRERFLSTRLARHVRSGSGWRYRVAFWVGRVWLDPYDPSGTHIGATVAPARSEHHPPRRTTMNRAEVLNTLAQILNDNIGQRLTMAMANGVMTTLAQRMPQDSEPEGGAECEVSAVAGA